MREARPAGRVEVKHEGSWDSKLALTCLALRSQALTTVEGLISRAISGLEQDQPTRRVSRGFLKLQQQGIIVCVKIEVSLFHVSELLERLLFVF